MLNWEVNQYAKLIQKVLDTGHKRPTRAGDAYSIFGETLDIDIEHEFPLLLGRQMFYKPVLGELAAMLRGPKHVDDFKKFGCNYWDSWGNRKVPSYTEDLPREEQLGGLKLDYGNAWIDFNGVNQLEELVDKLRNSPYDRRLIVTGWRPDHLDKLSLPCCHMVYQWYVRDGTHLDMVWYQRSVDTMVGLPSDIILAAAWNIILAQQTKYTPGRIKFILGDTHIYANHVEPTLDYLRQLNAMREYNTIKYEIDNIATMSNFIPAMLDISGYEPALSIKFKLNV